MLRLPPQDSKVRECFDLSHLAEMCAPENRLKLPTFRQALTNAKSFFGQNKGVKVVNSVTLRANGELWLIQVGPRGGWKVLWNFGQL
jgi:hypothetical protein